MKKCRWNTLLLYALLFTTSAIAQTNNALIPVNVNVGDRTLTKLPFVIAKELALYEKYGLDADIRLSEPEFPGGIETEEPFRNIDRKLDFSIGGHGPNLMSQITHANTTPSKAIGSTDCTVRTFIIGKKDAAVPFDYRNKRIGVSNHYTTTHYVATLLAKRYQLDPLQDLAILLSGRSHEDLERDQVDALVMTEVNAARAIKAGYKILEDTGEWNVPIAGNSINVNVRWLNNEANHAKAKAFLQAIGEALAILHKDKDLTLSIIKKWYGMNDPEMLGIIYGRAVYLPKKPLPCIEGVQWTLNTYESNITRRYQPTDFYDDHFAKELDESGFFDSLYQ